MADLRDVERKIKGIDECIRRARLEAKPSDLFELAVVRAIEDLRGAVQDIADILARNGESK